MALDYCVKVWRAVLYGFRIMTDDLAPSRADRQSSIFLKRSIMICGAGHSGSTLLGMVLGRADGALYIGEGAKLRYLHDASKPLRKRACKVCGEDCPVWSSFAWDNTEPLYPKISAHVGESTIVDSTKDSGWITDRTRETVEAGGQPILLLLLRDGRAVVNSRIRKYPERDPAAQILDWANQIVRSRALFDGFAGPKLVVHYEELAEAPAEVIGRVCSFAGLTYDPQMLAYGEGEHHPLGGNNGTQFLATRNNRQPGSVQPGDRSRNYYQQHGGAIRPDTRWKSEFSAKHAALFENLAADTNRECLWGE